MEDFKDSIALMLKVRERGKFWLRRIHLEELTMEELFRKIYAKWNTTEVGEIFGVYKLWDNHRRYLKTDKEVMGLEEAEELEVIFSNPGSKDRASYTKWWYEKQQKEN